MTTYFSGRRKRRPRPVLEDGQRREAHEDLHLSGGGGEQHHLSSGGGSQQRQRHRQRVESPFILSVSFLRFGDSVGQKKFIVLFYYNIK